MSGCFRGTGVVVVSCVGMFQRDWCCGCECHVSGCFRGTGVVVVSVMCQDVSEGLVLWL